MNTRGVLIFAGGAMIGCGGLPDNPPAPIQMAPLPDHATMVWVEGGSFEMGAFEEDMEALPREKPRHRVQLSGFYMDAHEVTNAQFAEFIQATGYVTVAERVVETSQGIFDPGSMVFEAPEDVFDLRDHGQWWRWRTSANWKCPEGVGSTWENRKNHPVVHVAYEDASAYANWRNCRLPTEAEWEYAATSRGAEIRFPWGDEPPGEGKAKCNIWEGVFPTFNHAKDGYIGTAPVTTYEPNELGFWEMGGNVWELCEDWYTPTTYVSGGCMHEWVNPRGPAKSFDPLEPAVPKKVMRGGSFLCNEGYCSSYRVTARMPVAYDTGTNHMGFRCVRSLAETKRSK